MLLVADQPETHRFISEEERDYIITEIARVSSSEPITVSCPLTSMKWLASAVLNKIKHSFSTLPVLSNIERLEPNNGYWIRQHSVIYCQLCFKF